jgi:hypothetical protein
MIQWKHLPSKVISDVVDLCDGHTIFKVEAFTDLGVPSELIEQYAQEFESNTDNYKETIFDGHGKIIPKLKGVYGLDVIESINRELGLPAPNKFGRGFRADLCRDQIKDHLGRVSTQ